MIINPQRGSDAEVIIGGMKPIDYTPRIKTPATNYTGSTIQTDFSYDKDANVFVAKIINPETKELIRQIPPELMLELAKEMGKLQGNVIDEKI